MEFLNSKNTKKFLGIYHELSPNLVIYGLCLVTQLNHQSLEEIEKNKGLLMDFGPYQFQPGPDSLNEPSRSRFELSRAERRGLLIFDPMAVIQLSRAEIRSSRAADLSFLLLSRAAPACRRAGRRRSSAAAALAPPQALTVATEFAQVFHSGHTLPSRRPSG